MKLDGVHVATITPFHRDGKLALPVLEKHLQHLVESGVDGLVPCGTTGEGSTLSREERRDVLLLTIKAAHSRDLIVTAGCNSNCTATVLELTEEAKELGCDAALAVTPYYNKPTAEGLLAHYQFLAKRSPLPLVLYNVPGRTNVNLTPEITLKLLEEENIVGIKEASGQYGQWLALSSQMNLSTKSLLAGDDDAFALVRILGGSGIISASANVVPSHFVSLYRLSLEKKWEEAFQLQKKLYPLLQALFMETNPAPIKFAMNLISGCEPTLRLPLVSVRPQTENVLRSILKALELIG